MASDVAKGFAMSDPSAPEAADLGRRLARALVCAAADPALSGVLLFDLESPLIEPVARLFTGILTGADEADDSVPFMLGANSRDEDLWTRLRISGEQDGLPVRVEPGPLIEGDGLSGPPSLVVIPDLTRLSVAGMRAAVQLVGADVAVVEHSGLRRVARPRARWLACCRSADVGRLSPHLLDRFAIRFPAAGLRRSSMDQPFGSLPSAWRSAVDQGARSVTVTDDALARVSELLGSDGSIRRELALARMARTLTALDGEETTSVRHCDAAARVMGLTTVDAPQPSVTDADPAAPPPPRRPAPVSRTKPLDRHRPGPDERHTAEAGEPLHEAEPPEAIGPSPGGAAALLTTPYPEDRAKAIHDFAPLRRPWQRPTGSGSARGIVVGTRRARDLRDLAHVRTVREAAVHQRVRGTERFTVSPVDLHSYVRADIPERMLVLVLDHTCRAEDWDWQDALTPFLQWAYTVRAVAQVVEVGSAEATDELRADSFAVRSVLDPRILTALYRPAGRATPLAHGIEQAAQGLRRAFQQYGSALAEAWLVVVTDGRGNVPLRASHTGRLEGPVGAAGVEDAFEAAARVGAMDRTRLHVAVVGAVREPYGDLPFALAETLGGTVVEARPDHRNGAVEQGVAGEW